LAGRKKRDGRLLLHGKKAKQSNKQKRREN
jgi:hypothetical protein